MITYQEEKFVDIFDDIRILLEQHWKELANHQDERPLDPDFETYKKLNELGSVKIFTVRDDGLIVGYFSFYIANNAHYKTWKYAVCDVYYLAPDYRKTGLASAMFQEVEHWLRSLEVKSVTLQEKIKHPHESLFKMLGYNMTERLYEKVL